MASSSSSREQQLEVRLVQQEAELKRLQEELDRARLDSAGGGGGGGGVDTYTAGIPHAPPGAATRPLSARSTGASGAARKTRYLFSEFPATLLAPPANGPQLYPCEGLSAVAHEGRVVLFGGTNGSTITHDTISYNLATGRWRRMLPTSPGGQMPPPRYGHSAVVYHNQMYVYGGFGPGGITTGNGGASASNNPGATAGTTVAHRTGLLNSLYSLDLYSGDWTCISPFVDSQLPSKNHTAVLYGSRMYVFGGCLPEGRTNAVRCYDLEKRLWLPSEVLNAQAIHCNQLAGKTSPAAAARSAPLASGASGVNVMAQTDVPAPRSGHSACVSIRTHSTAHMVIFGGRLSKFAFSSDVFQYDLNQQTWMRLYCGGDLPEGRCDHTAVMYRDHMVIYGGYAVHEDGTKKYFNDVYALDLVTCTWSKVSLTGPSAPLGSCGHASVMFETTDNVVCMATFGGWGIVPEPVSLADEDADRMLRQHEGDICYRTINDVWVFQIAKAPTPHAASSQQPGGSSRPTSARREGSQRAVSPRQPSVRPSTARSTRTGVTGRSASQSGGRPAFVTHASRATTAKIFGDAPMTERLLRMVQHGSPKRSTDELQSILSRLTDNRVHEKMLDGLRSKHIKEVEPNPLTADEQQEITDRLYYQQIMVQEERSKVLRSKYLPVVEREHASEDHIQDMVLRLHAPIERPELEPRSPAATVPKQKAEELLKKLYAEDQKNRRELAVGLEKKYLWGPAAPKRSTVDIEASVKRLAEPISSTRQR